MELNITTLLLASLSNAVLMIAALWACVGFRQAPGLRAWTLSLLCQAIGFSFLIVAGWLAPRVTASIGIFLLSLAVSRMQSTTARFTGQHLNPAMLLVAPVALGLVHWLVYFNTQLTIALTNLVIGAQTLWAAHSLLHGAGSTRWRWLVGITAVGNALLLLGRAWLVIFHFDTFPAFIEPHPLNVAGMLLLNGSMVLGTVGYLLAHRDEAEQALNRLASFDSLTGLYNRRVWLERSALALGRNAPSGHALMMLDLDHFKAINDARGHPVGDKVLQLVGQVIHEVLRRDDIAGRYGGEEFCILLNDCSAADFDALDARLHRQLAASSQAELGFAVVFSAGVIQCASGMALDDAIRQVDVALYRAKHSGRNRTCRAAASPLPA